MNNQFIEHQKWATRLFLVVSGVWFFRVLLMLWLTIHKGPVGFDPVTFQGPALIMLYILSYLFPLLIAELYFSLITKSNIYKLIAGGLILITTIGLAVGSFAATMGMWLPRF